MSRKGCVSVLCAICLVGATLPSHAEPTLNAGIQQAQEGDYAAAVTTLRSVAERLASNPQAKADLKTAYVYLAVAHLGLDQETDARRAFVSALKLDPALQVKTTDFPPRVVRFFEKVHQEAIASGEVRPAPKVAAKKSGGSGTTILLVGGGVAAAGVGAAVLLGGKKSTPVNHPPLAGAISVTPTFTGISSATEFTFVDNGASDADGDPLTFAWNFGDGSSGQGQTAKHTYPSDGHFTVTASVSDGKATTAAPALPAPVAVVTLNGTTWLNSQGTITRTWIMQQSGANLTGTYTSSYCKGGQGQLTGTVSNPRNVHIQASIAKCGLTITFDGVTNDPVDQLIGHDGSGNPLTFVRQ
jgi:hypothetical protein